MGLVIAGIILASLVGYAFYQHLSESSQKPQTSITTTFTTIISTTFQTSVTTSSQPTSTTITQTSTTTSQTSITTTSQPTTHTTTTTPLSLKEKFVGWAVAYNNLSKADAEEFYDNYTDLVQKLFPEKTPLLKSTLKLYSQNSTVFGELYRNIYYDLSIGLNKNEFTNLASQLFLDLGYGGKVKVLVPGTNSYREGFLSKQAIQAFGNYSIALHQLGLPKHDKNDLFLLGNATVINPDIVDFEPLILKDMDNKTFVIQSKNLARDYWMIAEHLKRAPYVVNFPEMFEAFSIKVQQNAFDILDNPRMHDSDIRYKPTDKVIWEEVIVPQWQYYWDSCKQSGNLSKRVCVFPWYNITLLKEQVSNSTDRKIALMYFWELLPKIADIDSKYPYVFHYGLDAMKYQIQQMPEVYEKVIREYPNGTRINPYTGREYELMGQFYHWVGDRGWHGLANMEIQIFGTHYLPDGYFRDFDNYMVSNFPNSINAHLSKNFPQWELIKFIYGYGVTFFGGDEIKAYDLYLPIAMKAFGVPHSNRGVYYEHYINAPARYAIALEDIVFGLPDCLLKPLREGKYKETLIFPGNGFSCIGSPLYGIKKDLEYGSKNPVEPNAKYLEDYLPLRGENIYLFKMGNKGR
ncbi:MAG: hypothetical protein QW134_09390 [Nitrososphaeria archaeon]